MITKREAENRGEIKLNWLHGKHSFSFGSYLDPKWMGFSVLKVLNDDLIFPHTGVEKHRHRNMEILSFVIEGKITHQDNLGRTETIKAGEIQLMSAGKGIFHSEENRDTTPAKMLQIWIEPHVQNTPPSYQKLIYPKTKNQLHSLVSNTKNFGEGQIKQDVEVLFGEFDLNEYELTLNDQRVYWIQIMQGEGKLVDTHFKAGDGFAIEVENFIKLNFNKPTKFLLFDLPEI